MNNAGTALVILLLLPPHVLEGRERRQDGDPYPDGVLSLWGSYDLHLRYLSIYLQNPMREPAYFHRWRGECAHLLLYAICNTREHCRPTREDYITVELATDVQIALHD